MSDDELHDLAREYERDFFVYSGDLYPGFVGQLLDLVDSKPDRAAGVSLVLTTNGGDPHAAFRLARCLRTCYEDLRLLVTGPCKSAGTLVAVGAHSIAFGPRGELGPLDIQMTKPDELFLASSGLDMRAALAILTDYGYAAFQDYLVRLAGAGLSTKVAAEIADTLAAGLFEPIAAQIDPLRLGEAHRAIEIAHAYGDRLRTPNLRPEALHILVEEYPTHGFVIDRDEAENLFFAVDTLSEVEAQIASRLGPTAVQPAHPPAIFNAAPPTEEDRAHGSDQDGRDGTHPEARDGGESGHPGAEGREVAEVAREIASALPDGAE